MVSLQSAIKIAVVSDLWKGALFSIFDDGDIHDHIDIRTLENKHDVGVDPDWSLVAGKGGEFGVVCIGLGKSLIQNLKAITLDIGRDTSDMLPKEQLAQLFHWVVSVDQATGHVEILFSEDEPLTSGLALMKWESIAEWIMTNQFMLHIHDRREFKRV